ncbi:4'-phosphopantetheinyl transferase superfamily protein [Spongiibacter sp. KMU-158]|uniref:Enterobactin synthase component D n=1 Tax=Spongiibacter pelagi TaxID=2760804 RepID=A0A927GUD0_9GAMM|nr:4'-phosphopantetheinyl transferase superfamily protein [Spongiibacter pelagi]MBD2857476.1 4'-phosphopantetheinyl transferase superfamily protein [Spongiibacter pelagi]
MSSVLEFPREDHFLIASHALKLQGFDGAAWLCRFSVADFRPHHFCLYQCDFPEALRTAVPSRWAEFLAGRFAARRALSDLGAGSMCPPMAADGLPQWPELASGLVVGSISHSRDWAVAAAMTSSALFGIDIEHKADENTVAALWNMVLSPAEQKLISRLIVDSGVADKSTAFTLAFSAKESLYKALYPKLRLGLEFSDLTLQSIDITRQQLRLKLIKPGLDVGAEEMVVHWQDRGSAVICWCSPTA